MIEVFIVVATFAVPMLIVFMQRLKRLEQLVGDLRGDIRDMEKDVRALREQVKPLIGDKHPGGFRSPAKKNRIVPAQPIPPPWVNAFIDDALGDEVDPGTRSGAPAGATEHRPRISYTK